MTLSSLVFHSFEAIPMTEQVPTPVEERAIDDSPRNEIHLAEYWAVIVKRRKLVVLSVVLIFAFTIVRTFLTPPSYRATAMINVEKDYGTPFDVGNGRVIYPYWEPEYIPTQIRL